MRGVTLDSCAHVLVLHISTQTPHARRDYQLFAEIDLDVDFNSHASCEA